MKRLLALSLLLTCVTVSAQVVPGSGSSGGPTSGIVGQVQTATGGTINNGTMTFVLSQPAVVSGSATLATQAVSCYTSTAGNIVGIPDPLVLPITSVNASSGSLPAGNYFVKIYYIGAGGVSISSPEIEVSLSSQGALIVQPPVLHPSSATGFAIGIGTTTGGETLQGSETTWIPYFQAGPLTSGAAMPTVNNSSCSIYFSDELIPTGTYYTVNLINKNGAKVAGYPQTWCTYGGAGGIINVSQGAPTGNCNTNGVYYPTPLISNPLANGTQSISGPLTVQGLTSPSVNQVLNPTLCNTAAAPAWCTGSDLGAWINAAFTACGGSCIVQIPPGTYAYTTTIVMNTESESLIGAGSYATILDYNGSSDGLFWQMANWSPGIKKAGALRGLSIVGTSSAINCIHSGSLIGSTWDDVTVSGCTGTASNTWGTGANGILLENARIGGVQAYTERTYMHNLHLGYSGQNGGIPGNTNGLHLTVNGGTQSFAYSEFDIWLNVEANQIGMLVDSPVQLYHSDTHLKGNIDATPASILTAGGAIIQGTLNILAEGGGSIASPNMIHVTSSGLVNEQGNVQVWDGNGPAGIAVPQVDPGGFYVVEPWVALDYPGMDSITLPHIRPIVETGYAPITSDGTIVVAQASSGDFEGRLIITWPNSSTRAATMIIDVACADAETISCSMDVPVNYASDGNAVFSNPVIKLAGGSPSVPQLQLTIGNRAGFSENVTATWLGSPGQASNSGTPALFPGSGLGTVAVATVGTLEDISGNFSISNHFNQSATNKFAGACTMSATSCTFTLSAPYAGTPICVASVQGTTAIAGACSVSGTTVTITAASSNSQTWGAILIGNPN